MRKRRQTSDGAAAATAAWLACREFIRAPPLAPPRSPSPCPICIAAAASSILLPPHVSRVGATRVWLAATDLCARKGAGGRAGHHLPFYVWIFFCLSRPRPHAPVLPRPPVSSIKRASLDSGGPRATLATRGGHERTVGQQEGLQDGGFQVV